MLEILQRGMNIVDRVRGMDILSNGATVLFGVLLAFGIINCILGYRLLRFWMMLFGFVIGAGIGVFGAYQFGIQEKYLYLAAGAGCGIVLAVIAFLSYRAGVFIMGAGLGLSLSVYVIHPTSSLTFFLCILAGVGCGILAIRFEREVLIVGTSILGGVLSGFSTAKLLQMGEIPYGILMSVGYAVVGMLLQFAINRPRYEDDEDYEEERTERKSSRGGRQRTPGGKRRSPEADFDERVYEEIYNSLDEDDIEDAYLKEKVLNEADPDPVEDFINEKIDEVKEHRQRRHPASSGPEPAEKTEAVRERKNAASEENSGISRKKQPSSAASAGSARKKASPYGAGKQVDFPLTEDDEIASVHQKAWEQKKQEKRRNR